MSKTKAHIRYRNIDNEIVPGVTTIIGLLNKPALVPWANKLGLQGIDCSKYTDDKAEIGSLAHAMIMAELKCEKVDTSDYSTNQIAQAENCYLSWLEWGKGKDIKPICVEVVLVSNEHQFGGTPDFFGSIDGSLVLGDYKTGGVYKEAYIQTCAYRQLLIENGYPPADKIIILGIPRTEDEKFTEVIYTEFETGWQIFYHLRQVYDLLKKVK